MDNKIKKIIRILADKYEHEMFYDKDILIFKNVLNYVEVHKEKKGKYVIKYNVNIKKEELVLTKDFIFDVLMKIFERPDLSQIKEGKILITLDKFFEEENYENMWREQFEKAYTDEKTKGIIHKKIGGNRFLVEYYKGVIIFIDDLSPFASNAILYKDLNN